MFGKIRLGIKGGPSKWQMMLAAFHGERVFFNFFSEDPVLMETVTELMLAKKWHFGINDVHFKDSHLGADRCLCTFTTAFPVRAHDRGWVEEIHGEINLETREGFLDITQLCENGYLLTPSE